MEVAGFGAPDPPRPAWESRQPVFSTPRQPGARPRAVAAEHGQGPSITVPNVRNRTERQPETKRHAMPRRPWRRGCCLSGRNLASSKVGAASTGACASAHPTHCARPDNCTPFTPPRGAVGRGAAAGVSAPSLLRQREGDQARRLKSQKYISGISPRAQGIANRPHLQTPLTSRSYNPKESPLKRAPGNLPCGTFPT